MTTRLLRAFHGDPAIQQKYVDRIRAHRAAESLVRGVGWEEIAPGQFRGCAVGCTLESYDHARYEDELEIPEMVARLEDTIFEGLTYEAAMAWPERFLLAAPVGADLSRVGPRVMQRILIRRREALESLDIPTALRDEVRAAIVGVEAVIAEWIATGVADQRAAWRAERAAWRAARSEWRAVNAESAAWSAWSAWSAAWSAARSAAGSAAGSAESAAEYAWLADVLVEEMQRCALSTEKETR